MKKTIFIIFLIIINVFYFNIPVYASGSFDFARVEASGNSEPVSIPSRPSSDSSSGSSGTPTSTTTTEEDTSITISVPTSIQGVVYEDYKRIETVNDGSLAGTKYVMNNYTLDSDEPTIEGVKVTSDSMNLSTVTDSNGTFMFTTPGSYSLRFIYGLETSTTSYETNKNALKYNGQDYTVYVNGSGFSSYEKSYFKNIETLEESYTEIYILIDYSNSMRNYGDEPYRIEIVTTAAINFVNELFEETDGNVAVGFIAFAYDAVVIKKPTEVKDDVIDAITNFDVVEGTGVYSGKSAPNFTSLNHRVGTNIGNAVLTAKDSFLSDKSNQVIVLFSDGAATAHNDVTSLYESDTDDEMALKLDLVATKTNEDIQTVVDSGITLISILNKTTGLENDYVTKTFTDSSGHWLGKFYEVDYSNRSAVEAALLNQTLDIIIETQSEFTNISSSIYISPNEDRTRRSEVNNYYSNLYYENLSIFRMIENLTGTQSDVEKVLSFVGDYDASYSLSSQITNYNNLFKSTSSSDIQKFISNSWMQTENASYVGTVFQINRSGGKVSSISNGTSTVCTFSYYEDEDSGTEYCVISGSGDFASFSGTYESSDVNVVETTIAIDVGLVRRDEFKLEIEKDITGARLTLSSGIVLYNLTSSNANLTTIKNQEIKRLYIEQLKYNAGFLSTISESVSKLSIEKVTTIPDAVWLIIENDVLQGSTIEIEYTITVKNSSGNATFVNDFSLIDYFDFSGVVYDADAKLLTEDATNADYGWELMSVSELLNSDGSNKGLLEGDYIDEETYTSIKNSKILYVNFNANTYKTLERITDDGDIYDEDGNIIDEADLDYITYSDYANPIVGNNGQRYIKLVLSKVLASEVDSFQYENQVEILEYSNSQARRINYMNEIASITEGSVVTYSMPVSGNYVPTLNPSIYIGTEINAIDEIDTAIADPVQLIPPTGGTTVDNKKYITICVTTIGILTVIILVIKRYLMKRKIS